MGNTNSLPPELNENIAGYLNTPQLHRAASTNKYLRSHMSDRLLERSGMNDTHSDMSKVVINAILQKPPEVAAVAWNYFVQTVKDNEDDYEEAIQDIAQAILDANYSPRNFETLTGRKRTQIVEDLKRAIRRLKANIVINAILHMPPEVAAAYWESFLQTSRIADYEEAIPDIAQAILDKNYSPQDVETFIETFNGRERRHHATLSLQAKIVINAILHMPPEEAADYWESFAKTATLDDQDIPIIQDIAETIVEEDYSLQDFRTLVGFAMTPLVRHLEIATGEGNEFFGYEDDPDDSRLYE